MNVFLTSDHHFGHANILTFKNADGSPVRPHGSPEEMDEDMISKWNEAVKPYDKVYHLGDFSISKRSILVAARLNGKKVLIRGNHDIFKLSDYTPFFYDVRGSHKIGNFILTHIPVHPNSLQNRWCKGNVHGHMHNGLLEDERYMNVSVERTGFYPVAFEEIEALRWRSNA